MQKTILSIFSVVLFGCSTVPKTAPSSYKEYEGQNYCVELSYHYMYRGFDFRDTESNRASSAKTETVLASVIKKYGIDTHCNNPIKNFRITINNDYEPARFLMFQSNALLSIISFGIIPHYATSFAQVTITEENLTEPLGKFNLEYEEKYHFFNAENVKRVKDKNIENYGEQDQRLAPLGANIAVFLLQKLNSAPSLMNPMPQY
ncbi:MAG: hypothetical protein B7Y39_17950 [Bdellovibrio sp. 28-41-41]|nr:MAG: hypothetical protein B7Y39_17950 [Bdellovibrio sp. 28-41-41]